MGEMITCTRYGAPCTMTKEACRKRWEWAHKPHPVEIDLTPCLTCPERKDNRGRARRNSDFPAKRKLESGLLADGYISMAAGLQDVYSRMTIAEIAERYGVSGRTVHRYLRELDITPRPRCEYKISQQKAKAEIEANRAGYCSISHCLDSLSGRISQSKIGELLGVSQCNISLWCKRMNIPAPNRRARYGGRR